MVFFSQNFDFTWGGFGHAPKFPSPHNLLFSLRYWKRTGEKKALEMVEKTLSEMRKGWIFDHIGFGFHRYSTDHKWLVPHFEKMLYDQAMLSIAYIEAFQVTGKKMYRETAEEIFSYVLQSMTHPDGRLLHRYRDKDAAIGGYLDDYAFLIWGLIELYETTFDAQYLELALALQKDQNTHFWDDKGGSFFFTASDSEKLLARPKKVYDGAIPSGNSVSLLNLLRLSKITGRAEWEKMASRLGRAFSVRISQHPTGYTHFLSGVDFALGPTYEVVVVGEANSKETLGLLKALRSSFVPGKVVLFVPSEKKNPLIIRLAPYAKGYSLLEGEAAVYVCQNYSCKLPTSDPTKMLELLGEK